MRVPKVAQWIINALLLAAVLMILTTMLHAQNVSITKVGQDVLHGPAGQTLCDKSGNPTIIVDQSLDPETLQHVVLHEGTHYNQMMANGGCRAAMEKYRVDPRFALDQELEAYCVEIQVFHVSGNDRMVSLDRLSVYLWGSHRGDFTDYPALKVYVAQVCAGKLKNTPKMTFISSVGATALFKIEHSP